MFYNDLVSSEYYFLKKAIYASNFFYIWSHRSALTCKTFQWKDDKMFIISSTVLAAKKQSRTSSRGRLCSSWDPRRRSRPADAEVLWSPTDMSSLRDIVWRSSLTRGKLTYCGITSRWCLVRHKYRSWNGNIVLKIFLRRARYWGRHWDGYFQITGRGDIAPQVLLQTDTW